MCFLKECLSPVGVYQKHSDAVVGANRSICLPQGTLWIVYSATSISHFPFIHQKCNSFSVFHCPSKLRIIFFFPKLFSLFLISTSLCLRLSLQLVPSPPAAQWSLRKTFRPVRFCSHGNQAVTASLLCVTTRCSSESFLKATGLSTLLLSTMRPLRILFPGRSSFKFKHSLPKAIFLLFVPFKCKR